MIACPSIQIILLCAGRVQATSSDAKHTDGLSSAARPIVNLRPGQLTNWRTFEQILDRLLHVSLVFHVERRAFGYLPEAARAPDHMYDRSDGPKPMCRAEII